LLQYRICEADTSALWESRRPGSWDEFQGLELTDDCGPTKLMDFDVPGVRFS
jgi:hypothetical protein